VNTCEDARASIVRINASTCRRAWGTQVRVAPAHVLTVCGCAHVLTVCGCGCAYSVWVCECLQCLGVHMCLQCVGVGVLTV